MKKKCEFQCEWIKFSIASWVLINPRFQGLSVDQIMLNWREVAGFNVGVVASVLFSCFSPVVPACLGGVPVLLVSCSLVGG